MDTTLQDPLVGRLLDGRYLVRSRIARGGMATVYLAVDQRLEREVALKVMHAHLADDEQFTARFVREARAAARLSHPNVVQVFDQGCEGDLLYLAMEHLRGRTLRDVLTERQVLTPREALTVVEPVLDALAAAHRHGIVHRDVKPENVILTDDGRVKVADFGLARAATANTSTTGVLLGTVAYLAPELVVRGIADARSDVYATGIMLFEMLTGRQPFSGDVPIQVAYQHVNETVPAPSRYAPGLPAALDELVAVATARDPDERPDDAGELLAQLRSVRAELTSAQLDARPAAPAPDDGSSPDAAPRPGTARPATGTVTEVFAAPPPSGGSLAVGGPRPASGPNPTRALPSGHGGLLTGLPRLGSGRPGDDARHDPGAPDPTAADTEAAALAALLRRRRVTGMVALLCVVGLALALAVTAWFFAIGPGAYTDTPSVLNQQADRARQVLASKGLRSTQTEVFSAAPGGTVIGTDPAPGRPVRKDGAVELKVSKGPEQVTVPVLVGRQEDAARATLTQGHLTSGAATLQFSDRPKGEVMVAEPASGTQVRNGSTVLLTVSKGPAPVDVPRLLGRSQQDAEDTLGSLKLGWNYDDPQNDDRVPAGSVLSQSPMNGTLIPGQKVTLVLSKGPVLVKVPNVVGKQAAQAQAILEGAGFTVHRSKLLGGLFGTVRLQNPGADSMAPRGSTVTITIV